MTERLQIFDTTLRDGEQAPGFSMNLREKLRVGRMLAELRVDVIEAGFPAASDGDFESVRALAQEIRGPAICALARCSNKDIARAARALEPAPAKRLHVFVATSPIHREHKLKMDRDQVLQRAVEGVRYAREWSDDVEFSAEDALRTEPEFLAEVIEAVIDAGARTVNLPDTVGYTVPAEIGQLFEYLRRVVPNAGDAVFSTHCHDDLGLAVANSLAAVEAGARQVECTVNGIGERAGNCSLEELVMAVRTRAGYFGLTTGIDTTRLYPASRLLSSVTHSPVAYNKAVVGANAFAHEAGIHQHGMLANAETYEIMRPQDVGISASNLVLGKHSGRHAFRDRVNALGFPLDDTELERAFRDFKALADRKKQVFDSDIEALVLQSDAGCDGPWKLVSFNVTSGAGTIAAAAVELEHASGSVHREAAVGNGPVDATFKAIERATNIAVELESFDVQSVSVGEDAQGDVHLSVLNGARSYRGEGVSTDIVEAGAHAFLQAVNRIELGRVADEGAPGPAAEVVTENRQLI